MATQFKKKVSQRTQLGKASQAHKCLIATKNLVLIPAESPCPVGEQCSPTLLDQTFSEPILGSCFSALQFLMTYTGGICGPPGQADLTVYYADGSTYTNSYYTYYSLLVDFLAEIDPLKKVSRIKIDPYTDVTISDISCPGVPSPIDVTIAAHCNSEGTDVSVAITEDGVPTGFDTPHTFVGLVGSHTFAVPDTDSTGHPFLQWSTGETSTTITVQSGGTYTAYYQILPVDGGRLPFNVSKPYYYNGWYYIFYYRRIYPYTSAYTVYYAKSEDLITWDSHEIFTANDFIQLPFYGTIPWSCMCVDHVVCMVNYDAYTGAYSRLGTIQADGSISFADPVYIANYSGFSVRATKVSGTRKFFMIAGLSIGLFDMDCLFISDDDGATWTNEGYSIQLFGMNYGQFNFRAIPFNDGNKLIELVAPPHWATVPPYDYSEHKIFGIYRNPPANDAAVELGDYLYAYGVPPLYTVPIPPSTTVYSVDSGAEGCKLGDWIHVSYVDLSGNIQHKRANVATPSTWEDLGVVASLSVDQSLCASPVADVPNDAVYIFYSDDHNIYYRRWTAAGGLESQVTFYTVANPSVWNYLQNLTVYPDFISGRVIVAWMQKIGVLAENWNVYCSVLNV